MKTWFGIGKGSVQNYRRNARDAVLEMLKDSAIYWPDSDERREIARRFEEEFQTFKNLVNVSDGTLRARPETNDYADYHGRKGRWTLTAVIISDDKRRIRQYVLGFPGCCHDQRVFRRSKLFNRPRDHLSLFETEPP